MQVKLAAYTRNGRRSGALEDLRFEHVGHARAGACPGDLFNSDSTTATTDTSQRRDDKRVDTPTVEMTPDPGWILDIQGSTFGFSAAGANG
jgi:hypothetical protein